MADPCEDMKKEWPLEEIYIKDEPLEPLYEVEDKTSTTDDQASLSENLFSSESLLYSDARNLKIKGEIIDEFVKEEVDIPPILLAEATSSNGLILLDDINKYPNIGTENAGKKNINSQEKKTQDCSYCSKKFSQKRNLQRHILTHIGGKPHECAYCCRKFSQKRDLQRHILTHTGEKHHECSFCSKKFSLKGHLQGHYLTHTGDTPHGCPHCDQKFSQKGSLERHILTHTGEMPHECSFCGRKFILKGDLQRHILTHTGEKPHDCTHCNKKFNRKGNLQRHILTHTGDNA